jgi:lysyl-tRNA synthetase class 1
MGYKEEKTAKALFEQFFILSFAFVLLVYVYMLWTEKIVEAVKKRFSEKIKAGKPIIIRDEKTLSGRVHVGSLRGVAIHGMISEFLNDKKIANKFLYEFNDFDPMDGLPIYLDENKFRPYMGRHLIDVPSPDGKAKNYPEYFGGEFAGVIKEIGYKPEYYKSSDLYKAGKYNDLIKKALDGAERIREIYKEVSGADKPKGWLPLSVRCEKCGKIGSTLARDWDGKTVAYECGNFVEWAVGCGNNGRMSPFDGNAKLPWKVEWAAKFTLLDVDIEGGGKDHSTRGGARQIADAISREIFKREPPINIPYEFIQAEGKKMSSSKGKGSSSREVADLLPPEILRTFLLQKPPERVVEFVPDGDTVPLLYDSYDRFAKSYWSEDESDFSTLFQYLNLPEIRSDLQQKILPRFSTVVFLAQMPHLDPKTEIEKIDEVVLGAKDVEELDKRVKYAKIWLNTYAPDDYKYEIQKDLPSVAKDFNEEQKKALQSVLEYIKGGAVLDGQEFHTKLHEIKTKLNIDPKLFFSAIYQSILGKESGPKAGWFLSVLDKKFLEKRLEEASRG